MHVKELYGRRLANIANFGTHTYWRARQLARDNISHQAARASGKEGAHVLLLDRRAFNGRAFAPRADWVQLSRARILLLCRLMPSCQLSGTKRAALIWRAEAAADAGSHRCLILGSGWRICLARRCFTSFPVRPTKCIHCNTSKVKRSVAFILCGTHIFSLHTKRRYVSHILHAKRRSVSHTRPLHLAWETYLIFSIHVKKKRVFPGHDVVNRTSCTGTVHWSERWRQLHFGVL